MTVVGVAGFGVLTVSARAIGAAPLTAVGPEIGATGAGTGGAPGTAGGPEIGACGVITGADLPFLTKQCWLALTDGLAPCLLPLISN